MRILLILLLRILLMIRFKHSVEDSFGFFHFIVVFYGFFVKVKKPGFFLGKILGNVVLYGFV